MDEIVLEIEDKFSKTFHPHVEFEVGQHMWLDIQDFNMLDGLASQFIAKYVGPYEIVVKPHPNVYMLKLPTSLWHTHGVFMFQS